MLVRVRASSVNPVDNAIAAGMLVVGATGGVGSLAVQLAVAAGATVIAPAFPEADRYLRALGVADVLPRDDDVTAAVRELNVHVHQTYPLDRAAATMHALATTHTTGKIALRIA